MFNLALFIMLLFISLYFISIIYFNGGNSRKNEPTFIRGYFPYFGVIYQIIKQGYYPFLRECKEKYGSLFTIFLFGHRNHIITNYKDFQQIQKKPKLFTIKEIFDNISIAQGNPVFSEEMNDHLRKTLLQEFGPTKLDQVSQDYSTFALQRINEIFEENQKDGSFEVDLYEFTRTVVYHGSSKAILGDQFNAHLTENDLFDYDSGSYLAFFDFPTKYIKKVENARVRLIEYIKTLDEKNYSIFLLKLMEAAEKELIPHHCLSILMASQTNSVNGSFWGLYNILKNSEVKKEALKEVEMLDVNNYGKSIEKMNYMFACFNETTRVNHTGMSFRIVEEDTSLLVNDKKFQFRKGDRVYMMPMEYENKEIFPNPEQFDPTRFLNSNQNIIKQVLIPFGGGSHLCPGKNFGTNEMILYCALFLKNFDCEILSSPPDLPREKAGFETPPIGIKLRLTKK
jgi:cytochrome P450